MGLREGLRSRKVEILADSTVTLEQGTDGVVASEVIKKMLKVMQGNICKRKLAVFFF